MTELAEGVAVGLLALQQDEDYKCDKKDEDKGWKSRVNTYNSQETCTGSRLFDNMKAVADAHKDKGLGVVPSKRPRTNWRLKMVTPTFFPIQAHHLIPKNFLPEHKVCVWLAIKYSKNSKYKLKYDSNYDTDDENNGYCMPYATPLVEWKIGNDSQKVATAIEVMRKTGIQLHQGSHASLLDPIKLAQMAGKEITPSLMDLAPNADSDSLEEARIHGAGYLDQVKELLNVVDAKALLHVKKCGPCRATENGGKTEVLPSEKASRLMHRVSAILKVLIDAKIVFVSNFGYFYAFHQGHVEVKGGRIYAKATKAQLRSTIAGTGA